MDKKMKHFLLVAGNSVAVVATIIVNALAVILPLNGKSTNELSDAIPNLFVPAGITFSIWSVIYILLIVFMLYQIYGVFKKGKTDLSYLDKIGGWFILASIANILWIFLWHYEYVSISLLAMILLFFSLLMIYLRLGIGLSSVDLKDRIAVHTTISVYLGWITVATIANVTAVLVKLDVGELVLGEMMWTILVIAVAALITILMVFRRKDVAYSLVIVWALLGIVIKRLGDDPIYGVQTEIATAAGIAIVVIFVALGVSMFLNYSKRVVSKKS